MRKSVAMLMLFLCMLFLPTLWGEETSPDEGTSTDDGSEQTTEQQQEEESDLSSDLEKIDVKKIKKQDIDKALDLLKSKGGSKTSVDGNSSNKAMSSAGEASLDLPSETKTLDSADIQYCEVHMKIAKRNYRMKRYDRAMEELKNVLSVDRNHGEAIFMKSVIEAKRKNFLQAWRDAERARQLLGDTPKLMDYISRLERVYPKPSNLNTLSIGSRPIPTHASEHVMDLLEFLFTNPEVGKNISSVSCKNFEEQGAKAKISLVFLGKDKLNSEAITRRVKELTGCDVQDTKEEKEGKEVSLSFISPFSPKNQNPKAVAKLSEFLDSVAKECDVKIDESQEEPSKEENITLTKLTLISKGLTEMNDFLRKISPNTEQYRAEQLEYTLVNNQPVWKAQWHIRFRVE